MQLFGTKGQKFLHCPGTKGQRDKLKILPRDGTGRDSLSKSGTGRGTGQSLFFSMISCFRTSFPVLERPFLFWNVLSCFRTSFSCYRTSFYCFGTSFSCFLCSFGKVILSRDVPGQRSLSRDFCSCPCPRTKGQWDVPSRIVPRDVPSLGNPS